MGAEPFHLTVDGRAAYYIIHWMKRSRATVRISPEVEGYLAKLAPVPQRQVERDLQRLELQGVEAGPPLASRLEGPLWELQSRVEGYGLVRIFYFRDGENGFYVFYAFYSGDEPLPSEVRDKIRRTYQQLTTRGP